MNDIAAPAATRAQPETSDGGRIPVLNVGPFLAGDRFGAVDAFFAPVAFRAQSYGLTFEGEAAAYSRRLLDLPAMREWYAAGLAETWQEPDHEAEVRAAGTVVEDLRAGA